MEGGGAATVLADRLTSASPDVRREMLTPFIHTLIGAEADALCGAGYSQHTNSRHVYRHHGDRADGGAGLAGVHRVGRGAVRRPWCLTVPAAWVLPR